METTLAQRCQQAADALRNAAPRLVLLQAQTTLALVTFEVQQHGFPGPGYSTTLIPSFLFASKAFNAGGRSYIKANKLGSYKGFRNALGLPTGFVNFTFTGRMFRSLQAVEAGTVGTAARARIVASTQEDADKVRYNTEKRGDFLAPTAAIKAEVDQVGQREITRLLDFYLKAG